MAQVITFEDYTPAPRFDGDPWTEIRVEEGTASTGPWTLIDTIAISTLPGGVDSDPTQPASRSFTTDQASDDLELWYRLIFADADGDTLQPTSPVQNLPSRPIYATVEELALILRVSAIDRYKSLRRVLEAAALEIDSELGLAEPYASPPELVTEVNLERAVEHWKQMEAPFGVIGLGADTIPTLTARDSWNRHAHKLAPLKETWGLA